MTKTMRERLTRIHPVHLVHRVSAAVLGLGLWVFAGLGFANSLAFFSTQGQPVMGMSTNGALSTISVVAGAILLGSALWGGRAASTVTAAMGAVFLVSGIVHLGILHTSINLLAFRLPNVFFSLIAGMLLLFSGLYGRLSGGLPPDNPYRRNRPRRTQRPSPDEQLTADEREPEAEEKAMLDAEQAMGEGHPTPEQQRLVIQDHAARQRAEASRAWRLARRNQTRG